MNIHASLSIHDTKRALSYMASGIPLHLIEVRLVNGETGDGKRPNLKAALEESGLGLRIHWFAIQEEKSADTVLFLPLYSDKFQKLIRKWNRIDGIFRFEMSLRRIKNAKAAAFYKTATYKQPDLLRAALGKLPYSH